MDLKFDWNTYRFGPRAVRSDRGKIMMQARVPLPGFAINCLIEPDDNGHSYNWTFLPAVKLGREWVPILKCRVGRCGQFDEPLEAMADLEKTLRLQIATCLKGEHSIIDQWWPDIVAVLKW